MASLQRRTTQGLNRRRRRRRRRREGGEGMNMIIA
jgi:hypothetical protein